MKKLKIKRFKSVEKPDSNIIRFGTVIVSTAAAATTTTNTTAAAAAAATTTTTASTTTTTIITFSLGSDSSFYPVANFDMSIIRRLL